MKWTLLKNGYPSNEGDYLCYIKYSSDSQAKGHQKVLSYSKNLKSVEEVLF